VEVADNDSDRPFPTERMPPLPPESFDDERLNEGLKGPGRRHGPRRDPLPVADGEKPSKTQRKAESHALQDLGEALAELNEARLAALPIAENLRDAVLEFQRTRSHEGRRRQMQYIGKLMRGTDTAAIRAAVEDARHGRAQDAAALHAAERWRTELIAGDDALTRFAAEHPAADLQSLRALVRNARKDAAQTPEQRSGRAYRDLFRTLRELLSSNDDV
jgi:ribosome-associated protein